MAKDDNPFQAFEHSSFNIKSEGRDGGPLNPDLYEAIKAYVGEKELPYLSLTANGVRFKNYVGALQVGKWIIEVLPKLDRHLDESSTQPILIQMLKQAGYIKTFTPTESQLKLKRNYLLDTYIQMFLEETRTLIHRGLVKKYRKVEENEFALSGKLLFNKHITKNIAHAERFYIRQTVYDRQHELNRVLLKTLKTILTLSVSSSLLQETNALIFHFPELDDIKVSDKYFSRLKWGRKTEAYKKAIEIARLILLNYHPDLSKGKNHVLALMFDMNALWEKWFSNRLKMHLLKLDSSVKVYTQSPKAFWFPSQGFKVYQKPDIIIELSNNQKIILDTKWKLVNDRPSEEDLRQMFTYNKLFGSNMAYLVYPGSNPEISGKFFHHDEHGTCGLKFISFLEGSKLSCKNIETMAKSFLPKRTSQIPQLSSTEKEVS